MTQRKQDIILLTGEEYKLRLTKVIEQMAAVGVTDILLCDNVNIYYLTGRIYCGFLYVKDNGEVRHFVRRPSALTGAGVTYITRPDEMTRYIQPSLLALELDTMSYSRMARLAATFGISAPGNASDVLRRARAVKTNYEIEKMRFCGLKQAEVYSRLPQAFRTGMTDVEFQIEIERMLRLAGCLGIFRITGTDMELHMGSILTGDNADAPSPYDFAMGGGGVDPSIPVGADGTVIRPRQPVMVDFNGNFNGYMTDMTRMYISGQPSDKAQTALAASIEICRRIAAAAKPGAKASDLYAVARSTAEEYGLADYFMGHRQHAGFVGHGVGITINELPVLAPRSRDILQAGNVIAVEPKFVIPGEGAVGIENTYLVRESGEAECLTILRDNFLALPQ